MVNEDIAKIYFPHMGGTDVVSIKEVTGRMVEALRNLSKTGQK